MPPRLSLPKEAPAMIPKKEVEKSEPSKENEIESTKIYKSSRLGII